MVEVFATLILIAGNMILAFRGGQLYGRSEEQQRRIKQIGTDGQVEEK